MRVYEDNGATVFWRRKFLEGFKERKKLERKKLKPAQDTLEKELKGHEKGKRKLLFLSFFHYVFFPLSLLYSLTFFKFIIMTSRFTSCCFVVMFIC